MRRVADWFRSHPLTTAFLVLIGCAVGAHLFANWRAEVRWQQYCTEARARGGSGSTVGGRGIPLREIE